MPAPAVYVIAIVGTVGVAFAFKEFIYPHLAPRIDRWKAEFQAAKKRRVEAERSAVIPEDEVALSQQGIDKDGHQNQEGDDSFSDHSDVGLGKGSSSLRPPIHPYMKNGLLIHRRGGNSETSPNNPGDVELDWITSTSTATETGSQQQDLRLTKNNDLLNESSHDFELKKTTETRPILDKSIQAIPYTPLSPVRTPTPTCVLYKSSSTHSPLDSPFSTKVSSLPEVALLSKLKTDAISSSTYPLLAPLQPPSTSPCAMANASASNAEPFTPSPPGLANIAVPGVAPFLPVSVDGTRIPDSSATSLPPLVPLSSPSALTPSSPPSQLLSPTWSHPSPYQTPPHVHAIPSLSQSYPLDDVLDYEHGLELLSPPSPLSRTDSPFELTGLSPRSGMVERSTLLLAGSGDSGELFFAAPVDSISNSTRSTTYVSFSSPALSASSVFLSENGYENDISPSEISSTFSSPFVAPTRLGSIGLESLPHDQVRPSLSMPPLSSGSSPPFDVNHPHHHRRERNIGWTSTRASVPDFSAGTTRSQESDAPIITFNDNVYDDYADTQTLRTRSPSTRTVSESVATTSTSTKIHPLESAAQLSRVTTSDSDFDTGSELSDLDFLSMSTEEYEASATVPTVATDSVGLGSRSVLYTGTDGSGVGRAGGIRGLGMEDGDESDTSSWSLAGGSE